MNDTTLAPIGADALSREELIAMAREAGFTANCGHTDRDGTHHPAINALSASVPVQWLERFAALVAARERVTLIRKRSTS